MKFTPKLPDESVNYSHDNPLKEFIILFSSLLFILIAVFIILGISVDLIVPKISEEFEDMLAHKFVVEYSIKDSTKEEKKIQIQLDKVSSVLGYPKGKHTVHIIENKKIINAMALPGRSIIIYRGLLDKLENEMELAFVLGHEMGHFKNRDHLKGLGRGLVFTVLSTAIFGNDSALTKVLSDSLAKVQMKFSQEQEKTADETGLEVINTLYGSIQGAEKVMVMFKSQEKSPEYAYWFSTHPSSKKRWEHAKKVAEEKCYKLK